jgi:sodium-dependent dicarboxylate transporter 2/3/5
MENPAIPELVHPATVRKTVMPAHWPKYTLLLAGPLLFWVLGYSELLPVAPKMQLVIGVAAWMMVWWISEAVALPVTAFLPIVLFPALGILDLPTTAANYTNPTILLFLSGFVFALAVERHNLHTRIALHIVRLIGTASHRLVLGFMVATAFVSMWVNNTAAALLMLPIAQSVLHLLEDDFRRSGQERQFRPFAVSLLLGLAYSASIGGIATTIGTPTNGVLLGFLRDSYKTGISFTGWFVVGFPLAVLMLTATYLILVRLLFPVRGHALPDASAIIRDKLRALGPIRYSEYAVSGLFLLTAIGWVFRAFFVKWLGADFLNDTIIGMSGALLLFLTPDPTSKTGFLFDWSNMNKLPWGILFMIGGGLALAKTLESSGIIGLIGDTVASSGTHDYSGLLVALVGITLLLKIIIANTPLATAALPMVFGIATATGIDPILLGAPVTFAASFAFVLPMSTPPNAIVLATSQVTIRDMIKAGLLLALVGFLLLIAFGGAYKWMTS